MARITVGDMGNLYPYLAEVVVEFVNDGYDYSAEFTFGLDLDPRRYRATRARRFHLTQTAPHQLRRHTRRATSRPCCACPPCAGGTERAYRCPSSDFSMVERKCRKCAATVCLASPRGNTGVSSLPLKP